MNGLACAWLVAGAGRRPLPLLSRLMRRQGPQASGTNRPDVTRGTCVPPQAGQLGSPSDSQAWRQACNNKQRINQQHSGGGGGRQQTEDMYAEVARVGLSAIPGRSAGAPGMECLPNRWWACVSDSLPIGRLRQPSGFKQSAALCQWLHWGGKWL